MRREVIGNATLYLGDCRDILPTLPKVDAVITNGACLAQIEWLLLDAEGPDPQAHDGALSRWLVRCTGWQDDHEMDGQRRAARGSGKDPLASRGRLPADARGQAGGDGRRGAMNLFDWFIWWSLRLWFGVWQ